MLKTPPETVHEALMKAIANNPRFVAAEPSGTSIMIIGARGNTIDRRYARLKTRTAAIAPKRCTLVELTEHTCRWPCGDPGRSDFFFCGDDTINARPYCAYHTRMAYQSPKAAR